ncbi:putative quinol monooxygenase [Beijerinckia mobilis]|uniref:putative quinol monooxygenase n=1 Tax=Beijerinckia mobilis TaxID=231434 RepID=UPI00055373B9|nr:antibiotic biosynthesis monooxygenase [Beijerinckia mobilis]
MLGSSLQPLITIAAILLAGQIARAEDQRRFDTIYVEVLPQTVPHMAGALKANVQTCLRDHLCDDGAVLHEIGDNERFLAYKSFVAKEATHEPSELMQNVIANTTVAPLDERQMDVLWESPKKPIPPQAFWVVTHVDVMPAYKDEAAAMLKDLGEASRAMPGHIRTIFGPQLNRDNHFTLIEIWANRTAFEAYQAAKPTRTFRTKLGPMLGALYDDRLYQSVN